MENVILYIVVGLDKYSQYYSCSWKNGSGKTNLLDCIIKALCGQGGGFIFYKHNDRIYSNIPKQLSDYKFTFEVIQFERFGSPLNSYFKEHINDAFVIFIHHQ